LTLCLAQLDEFGFAITVSCDSDHVVFLQAPDGVVQICFQTFRREDKLATEELS
jgi:hypothetical protein